MASWTDLEGEVGHHNDGPPQHMGQRQHMDLLQALVYPASTVLVLLALKPARHKTQSYISNTGAVKTCHHGKFIKRNLCNIKKIP